MTISSDWYLARDTVTWPAHKALLDAGVPKDALLADGDFTYGVMDIRIRAGRWEPMFRGDRAYVLPVHSPAGRIVDLVAFRIETPSSFWLRDGAGVMLGHDALGHAEHYREPLTVHETPFDWLRSGGQGCCVLDFQHYWPLMFRGVRTLRAKGLVHGQRLRAALSQPFPTPEILVPS